MIIKNFHTHRFSDGTIGATFQIEHKGTVVPTALGWTRTEAIWHAAKIIEMVAQDIEHDDQAGR